MFVIFIFLVILVISLLANPPWNMLGVIVSVLGLLLQTIAVHYVATRK
jgi:hypothetical protein